MPPVRYPVATLDGELVWAADLSTVEIRPKELTCVGFDDMVRLRAGAKNRPHFAHVTDALCPGGETPPPPPPPPPRADRIPSGDVIHKGGDTTGFERKG